MKKGICYRCMFGSHKHCYGDSPKTICVCAREGHVIEAAKIVLGMNPELTPPAFPEDPTDGMDRFYFIPNHKAETAPPVLDPSKKILLI